MDFEYYRKGCSFVVMPHSLGILDAGEFESRHSRMIFVEM